MADEELRRRAAHVVEETLKDAGLAWESPEPYRYVLALPGTKKLSTTCSLVLGRHTLSVNAFVVRRPDENHEAVYRWLLERNTRLYGMSYAMDRLGDIFLVGRFPLAAVTAEELDRILGTVLENADGSFNTLLELGFGSSIRKEWEWRVKRGESLRNLEAFARLAAPSPGTSSSAAPPPAAPESPVPESPVPQSPGPESGGAGPSCA